MNIKIFVVFHKILDEIIFSNFTPEEMNKWFIRYGVNQKHPKSIIRIDGQKHDISNKRMKDVILEYNLPNYNANIQERGFMETSCYVHVLENALYEGADLIGICQYDMIWTLEACEILRSLARNKTCNFSKVFGIQVGELMNTFGVLHPLTFADRINWKFLLNSYNRHFSTNHQPKILMQKPFSLFQTYLLPTKQFIELASWLKILSDELYPSHCMPPYETHWGSLSGKTERAESIFVAARIHENRLTFQNLPLDHNEGIVKGLGITKDHYGKLT